MKILILGASSYIGSRLYLDLKDEFAVIGTYYQHQLFPDLYQLDLTNKNEVTEFINQQQPDVIIHLANYSSSRYIPKPGESFEKLNLESTQYIVETIRASKTNLLFISSLAATNKQNPYGSYKAESEEIISQNIKDYYIIRPSAVIGVSPNHDNGKIIDSIIETIHTGIAKEFDNSWILQPTYIDHISQVVQQVIKNNYWNDVLNLFTNHGVTQYQIASDILSAFGKSAIPLDTGRTIPLLPDNSQELSRFALIPNSYEDIIKKIVLDIRSL